MCACNRNSAPENIVFLTIIFSRKELGSEYFMGRKHFNKKKLLHIVISCYVSFRDLYLLVSKMADSLHKEKLKIILVIPPPFYAG